MKKPYYKRVLLVLTAAFNVIVLNGAEDHTTSGRVGWNIVVTILIVAGIVYAM